MTSAPRNFIRLACSLILFLTPTAIAQVSYLKASNTGAEDWFGAACDVSEDTLVVGAWREDGSSPGVNGDGTDNSKSLSGAAYVFVRQGSIWSPQAYLKASNPDNNDLFGNAVAIDGDTIVVGAPWENSASTGVDGDQSDNSCSSSGAAYVFVRSGTTWNQQAYLKSAACDINDQFGNAVDVCGDRIVVGCSGDDSSAQGVGGNPLDNGAPGSGAAYVFHRTGTTWVHEVYLKAANADALDGFGGSVSLTESALLVGALGEDGSGSGANPDPNSNGTPGSGAAYLFALQGSTWTQEAYLKASNPDPDDEFGRAVAVFGDTLLISAPEEDSNSTLVNGSQGSQSRPDSGAAYVFVRSGTDWTQQAYFKALNSGTGDHFGQAVALSQDLAVVSTRGEDGDGQGLSGDPSSDLMVQAGAAYSYVRSGTQWIQKNYIKATNTEREDSFGRSIGLDGNTLVVGATNEDSGAMGADGDQLDNTQVDSGAAYVYELDTTPPDLPSLGIDRCSGDGGDQLGCTNCPCANNAPAGTIGGCLNSAGSSPRLFASGDPSVSLPFGSTTDLRFELTGVPSRSLCVLYSGDAVAPGNAGNPCFGQDSGVQSIQLDALRCSIQNVRRHGARGATAAGDVGFTSLPWGGEGGPGAGLALAGGALVAGQTRHFQALNREDPRLGCMRGLGSSQAVEVTFAP